MHIAAIHLIASLAIAPATASPPQTEIVRLVADLDGDGRIDSVSVSFPNARGGARDYFHVRVGGQEYDGFNQGLHGTATIVDIDTTDRYLEVAIPAWGPSDDDNVSFLRYAQGRLRLIGEVPGANLLIDGSGRIETTCRGRILCTWFYDCTFRWYPEAQVIAEVPRAFKHIQANVTLKHDLPLKPAPLGMRDTVTLKAGTAVTIDLTDDLIWCHARTEDGRGGWFRVGAGTVEILPRSMDVQEMFEGLPMMD